MKLKIAFFSLITVCLLSSFNLHPTNMSVGDLSLKDGKLNLKFKFFARDLESTLSGQCGIVEDLERIGYTANVEKCLQKYLSLRFAVSVNNTPSRFIYKKGTLNGAVLIIEYEAPLPKTKVTSLKIKNTILFDNYYIEEMKNIMNVNLFGKFKILEFDSDVSAQTGIYTQEIKY